MSGILDFTKAFEVQSDFLDGDYDADVRACLEAQAQAAVDAAVQKEREKATADTKLLDAWEIAGNESRAVMREVLAQ